MLQINKRRSNKRRSDKPQLKDNLSLAYEHISLRKFQLAQHYLTLVSDDKRNRVSYFFTRAMFHFYQDEYESAKEWATRGLRTHSISEMLLQMFINCCLILDEYVSAETHLEIALNAHPWNSIFHFQRAYLAWKIGDYNLATQSLSTGKKLNPDASIGYYLDAIIAVRKLKLTTAQRHAKELIEGDLFDSNAYALMGHILRLQNRTKLAGRCFKRAIELYLPSNTNSAISVAHDLLDKPDNPLPLRVGSNRGWKFSAEKITISSLFMARSFKPIPVSQLNLVRTFQRNGNNQFMRMHIKLQFKSGAKFKLPHRMTAEDFVKMYDVTNRLQTAYLDEGPYASAEIVRAYLM